MRNKSMIRECLSYVGREGGAATELNCRAGRAATGVRALMLAVALLLTSAAGAHAQSIVQEYYVPMPEAQIRASFLTLAPATGATMDSVISIVVAVAGTRVVYDHWEDGYEIDLNNPVQASTKIWGDGNDANGIPPGFVHDPVSFTYGTVLALRNLVPLPRNAATILYDGRDRVGATRGIVMSRSAWATSPGPVLADATEVQPTIDWGTNFIMPIGQNVIFPTPLTASMFEYTSMLVMAALNNTVVQIDVDGNGTVDITTTVNQGESYQVAGGVNRGATVTSTKPVQVQLLTGDIGANYESRWFTIPSIDQWSSQYFSPVGTASDGDDTYLFLYNPGVAANTINYLTRTGSGSFSIPAKSTYTFLAPQNSGTEFTSATGQEFFAVGTVGAEPTQNNVHDWGFDLVPAANLTTEAVVGWGPGSSDGTQNGSPVWVTPVAATTIYIDYNGDRAGPVTDPAGGKCDLAVSAAALEVRRIYEADRDQTGMRLYTLDGTLITAAWGQDPAVAGPGLPYLDVGTTIPNFPVPTLTKTSSMYTDVAPSGLSVGDTIEYTITLSNQGLIAIGNVIMRDPLPSSLTYVTGSTTRDGIAIVDSGVSAFPLDETGYMIPVIPRRGSTSFTYRTIVAAEGAIPNTADSSTGATSTNVEMIPPSAGATQCVIDFTGSGGVTITSTGVGADLYVTVTDADANTAAGTVQTFSVVVNNTTGGDLETITLTETGVNTGVFRNTSGLTTSSTSGMTPNDGVLHLLVGDTLSVSYRDPSFGDMCSDSTSVAAGSHTKILYLSTDGSGSPDQDLDRVAPAATSDVTTATTSSLAVSSGGSVSVSGAATSGTATGATSITFSHSTGSGTNTLLLVGVSLECNGANCSAGQNPTIGSVTFNNANLTKLGVAFSTVNVDAIVEVWYMFNPPASTTANVVVTQAATTVAMDMVGGAVTFGDVDTAQTLSLVTATGVSTAPSVTIPSAAGRLVFDVISLDDPGTLSALSAPRTLLWNRSLTSGTGNAQVRGAASYNAGAASVTEAWAVTPSTSWAAAGVSISPGGSGGSASATFTQTPALCEALTLPAGSVVSAQTYFTTGGSMPASPSVTAVLKYGATTIATSSAVSSDGSKLTFTFPALGSPVTVPSGSALELIVTNSGAVAFQIQYDSTTKPSFVSFATTTVIHADSVRVYDAAYSGGAVAVTAANGQTLYVRSVVGDPFGAADVTSLALSIDGSGTAGDISTTLGAEHVVNTTSCTKTYEYQWNTGSTTGSYDIAATAREGFENTVTASNSTGITLSQLDLGTPCSNSFTTGADGASAATYAANEQVCVRVTDLDQNTNALAAETVTATIVSGSGDSEVLTLTETGLDTGIFAACSPASSTVAGTNNNGSLYAPLGSALSVSYTDPNDATDVCGDTGVVPSGSPGVTVTKTLLAPADGQATVGEAVQFRVRVANTGNTTLSTVAVTDTFPGANLTYVSASPAPSSVGVGTLTWSNVGPMISGASVELIINYTALASASPAVNTAGANAGSGVTGSASAGLVITNPSLLVSKTLVSPNPGPATKGDAVVFSITVQNTGDTTIAALPLEDTYSGACFTFVSSTRTADGSAYGSLVWSDVTGGAGLAPGASTTLSVTLRAAGACNPATNVAAADYVTDANGDPVPPSRGPATIVTQAAGISGVVDEDQGAAGFGGDAALSSISVALHTDPNGDGDPSDGAVVQVQATLADGSYEFTNLALGSYVVVETDPIGYQSIDDTEGSHTDNRVAVTAATPTAFVNNNFLDAIINPADYSDVSGEVRSDVDYDGNLADSDSGIDGVTIDLYTDPNGDGDVSDGVLFLSTTTAGGGAYAFNGIPPGDYVVVETDPTGYHSTADSAGANDNAIPVAAPPAGSSTGNDFLDTNVAVADLSVTKTGPASVTPGSNVVYTVTVTNNGWSNAAAVSVADSTPSGLTFVSNSGDCVTAYPCSLGTVADGATLTITTTYSVPSSYSTPDPVSNTATVSSTTADSTSANNTATSSLAVAASADVTISKSGPSSITPGANVVYTVTVTNNGPSDAAGVSVADSTPSGLTFVSNSGGCTTAYPCSLGSVASGATRTITTTYSVPSSYTTPDPVSNTATVSSTTSDPTPANNSATSSIAVAAGADVTISKSGPSSITPGANVVYTVTVTNNGPSSAAGVSVADSTPSGLTFVSNSGDCVSAYPCSLGTVADGATLTITSTYSVPSSYTTPDPVSNTATVSSTTTDPTPANNTATSSIALAASADVTISKSGPSSITPGANVVYTVTVTNNGPSSAAGVSVADSTPSGLTFVSNSGDCVTAYPCSLGTVASGVTRTITSTYSVPSSYKTPDPVSNTATVSATTTDPTPANNTATSSIAVAASADIAINKTGPSSFTPGGNLVYTITVTNNGPSNAAAVSVADSTPSGLTFVSNAGGCTTAYPCSLGALAAGVTRTITSTFHVPSPYAGASPVVNTATVSSTTSDPDATDNSHAASSSVVGNISGVVFRDLDGDGTKDVGDVGLKTVTVRLNGPSCVSACVTTTNPAGEYSFDGLAFGSYTVVEVDPTDYTSTTPNSATMTVGLSAVVVDFGDFGSGSTSSGSDLSITKTHSGVFETCAAGNYTLAVRNLGPDASSGLITVTDTLPAGLTFVSAAGTGWACSAVGQVVTCDTTGVIAFGATSPDITLTVAIAEGTSTVNNTASVSSLDDTNPVNDTITDGTIIRDGSCGSSACRVSLGKLHSGNANPGGEVQYTLQWSNACRDALSDVTIVDPLPENLELLSATSPDAIVTIVGNTATFDISAFRPRTVGKAFLTARINPDAAVGSAIENVATLSDATGRTVTASNFFRVRGGSTDGAGLTCFVRAQVFVRPGRDVKYEVRYKNGSANNELSLTLPADVIIKRVTPVPNVQDGRTLYWGSLARTAGKVTVSTMVSVAAQDQVILTGSALMDDRAGQVAVCEHVAVVSHQEKLFTSIKGQTHGRSGLPIRYTARYREAVGSNQMTISLPNEVTVVAAVPAPSGGTDKTLFWNDLPSPTGAVKIDAVVNDVPDGTVMVASVTMTDESTDIVGDETQTVIGSGSAPGDGGQLALGLSALRSVTAGTSTDISARYEGLQSPGSVTLVLPPELTPSLAVPAATFDASTVVWTGLSAGSGLLKLRVNVDAGALAGRTLLIRGSTSDPSGKTATAQATTVIRDSSPTVGELSLALMLAPAVTRGLTTDVHASYDGLQGAGQLTLTLPPGLSVQSTVPAGALVVGDHVTWSGLGSSSGSVRARVLVSESLASGSVLSVSGTVRSGGGTTASAAGTTSVR